jgi:hypothetical protein
MSIEAMKQALDVLENTARSAVEQYVAEQKAISALRQAIEQAELAKPEQESISTNDHLCAMLRQVHDVLACTALPMKRPWVGLTQEELDEIQYSTDTQVEYITYDEGEYGMEIEIHPENFARAIEAKLRSKNDGSV